MTRFGQQKQTGMALVVALLVVAMVTVVAVELSWRFDLSMTRSGNRWHGMQAQAYIEGAENLAKIVLKTDKEETPGIDSLEEIWAQQAEPFPTDEGYVAARLEDAQGRFNLNLLAARIQNPPTNPQDWQRFTAAQKHFIRLLQTIELEEGPMDMPTAVAITEAVMDWLDQDDNPTGFNGAERDYYAQLEPPMTIANRRMISVSELMIIKGITPELYQALLPLVITLSDQAKMNVNTMSLKLIQSVGRENDMAPVMSEEDAQTVVEDRGLAGYQNPQEFLSSVPMTTIMGEGSGGPGSQVQTDYLGVESDFFLFTGEAMVGDHLRRGKALLYRTAQDVLTVRRTDAHY